MSLDCNLERNSEVLWLASSGLWHFNGTISFRVASTISESHDSFPWLHINGSNLNISLVWTFNKTIRSARFQGGRRCLWRFLVGFGFSFSYFRQSIVVKSHEPFSWWTQFESVSPHHPAASRIIAILIGPNGLTNRFAFLIEKTQTTDFVWFWLVLYVCFFPCSL